MREHGFRIEPSWAELLAWLQIGATLRDFYPTIGIVGALAGVGVALEISGHRGWFAGLALLAANAVLGYPMYLNHLFWKRTVSDRG